MVIINMTNLKKLQGNIEITMLCECYDADGKLKWTENINLNKNNTKNNTEE